MALYNLRRKQVQFLIRLYRDCPRDCFPVLNALADEIEIEAEADIS